MAGSLSFLTTPPAELDGELRIVVPAHTDKAALIAALADALDFPDWAGRSFDALADMLGDLAWLEVPRVVLVHEAPPLRGVEAEIYRDILIDAVEHTRSAPPHLVVVMPKDLQPANEPA